MVSPSQSHESWHSNSTVMKSNSPILAIMPLNELGNRLRSKSRTAKDTEFIIAHLNEFIRATSAPPPRGKDYRLHAYPQGDRMDPKSKERRLEAALHKKFQASSDGFLKGVGKISSFQVPLYSAKKKNRWGSIDVLGIDDQTGYPVVIELKIDKVSIEPLLRAVVEALAYMIALRINWDDFRPFWSQHTGRDLPAPKKLAAVILAPQAYWEKVYDSKDFYFAALPPLTELTKKLVDRDYHVRFASIDATDSHDGKEWSIAGSAKEECF
jgi:hypothetical protein